MNLVVLESGTKLGLLASSADRGVIFSYDSEYLSSPDTRALSLSLPLRPEKFPSTPYKYTYTCNTDTTFSCYIQFSDWEL